jgi:hypothetical protein
MSTAPKLLTSINPSLLRAKLTSMGAVCRAGRAGGAPSCPFVRSTGSTSGMPITAAPRLNSALMRGASRQGAILLGADLRDTCLIRADLRGACLRGANLSGADLSGCDLGEGVLAIQINKICFRVLQHERRPGKLDHAILTGTNLSGAKMTGTSAAVADFRDADLSNATLNGAKLCLNLDGANLSDAQLSRADFNGASLWNAAVAGANFGEAVTTGAEVVDTMHAPACMVFIDHQPLDAIIDSHDPWRRTRGRDGQPGIFSELDFRCCPSLAGRFLTAL